MKSQKLMKTLLACAFTLTLAPQFALAADRKAPEPKDADVSSVRDRYWARGEESELGVVQNRLYSKSNRLQLSVFGGTASADPMLSIYNAGGSLGYYLSEVLSIHAVGWKHSVSSSAALAQLQSQLTVTTNTNSPSSYLGGEVGLSFIYGKLSLAGAKIIHFDLFGLAGAGVTTTESGGYLTPSLGLGQQLYLSSHFAIRADYRFMYYHEQLPVKQAGTTPTSRDLWTNNVSLGVSLLL